ncbi:hypothetical protein CWRG_01918 [Chthonomonas calidirosea]|uniref:Uncharacterized conserved protein n=1 Tax=Chthonomonas calidirosea (strain DSM 23976 / ICMP 18418 / T49) TaxID=1303518 RepID=S0EX24_CHTCT|nr:DUF190 domain-containing protein [Chthonomonas calidirosea]CCW35966.1 Uncharacterized conserved protein [Chthonomonas calidirosea T49]CEK17690.1 hypothetical protein CWRG_01918 [Chthonomonas calidirosea]CEK18723.1 hypothetical protein CTKA_01935 [Chthonomonas calidirosea]
MKIEGIGKVLTIYIGSSDKWHGKPLYAAIVERARQEGLAGATVLEGVVGYGANSRIHRSKLLDLSTDLPIRIEIIDQPERINGFLPILDEMVQEGLITVRDCEIIKYTHSQAP